MILYLPIPGALAGLACLLCVQEGYLIGKEKKKRKQTPDADCSYIQRLSFLFFPCHVQLYNSLISLTGPPPAPAPAPQQKMVLLTRNRDDDDARESIGELCTGYSRRKLVL